jgi:hypothetical protein
LKFFLKQRVLTTAVALSLSPLALADISFSHNQKEVVFPPYCDHVPISFLYAVDNAGFDESLISVDSDSDWAMASVDTEQNTVRISFDNSDLIASYTATISVSHGDKTTELFVQATVPALDVYRLVDDPTRSLAYGIQKNGINNGSIFSFDPSTETIDTCLTVGKNPTDFVINDDSSELLVINSVSQTIDVIDLMSFNLKESINLPEYEDWSTTGGTTANIELGPDGIIYYVDGKWGPVLRVLDRSSNTVIQSLDFNGGDGTSNTTGFMDLAVTDDKTRIVAMPQYGWSAGSHSNIIGQYKINTDGTVSLDKTTQVSNFERAPFEAPVLLTEDDELAILKTVAVDSGDIANLVKSFPSAIWSMTPNGKVVATSDKLYEFDTGEELYQFSNSSSNSGYVYRKAQAFTSDYSRFIHFNSTNRKLEVVDLISQIGTDALGVTLNPQDGAVVSGLSSLSWEPTPGIAAYDVYLGTSESDVKAADTSSSLYLGQVSGINIELLQTLLRGTEYFWRVDPVGVDGPETGTVYSFIVSNIVLSQNNIEEETVAGFTGLQTSIQLNADEAADWSVSSEDDWISFTSSSGKTPSTLNIVLDATILQLGVNQSHITLTTDKGNLEIPVTLRVNPLSLTHIRSDQNSSTMYAISEDTSNVENSAYLLDINSEDETIQRMLPVGSSVTDFTIHYTDNLIYITNWKTGELLAVNIDSFEVDKTIEFAPAGATGYSSGDVYRVAAGVSQRIIVEEEDQWIDISLFDTESKVELDKEFVREGGGSFGPEGRYYYHGENNSSGASIIKFDTSGDTLTQLAEVRPEDIASSYGSRTVVVSEDGSRVFWAGVVLNNNLESEWRTGDIVYSTSQDGSYAFSSEAIYDVNLQRQVFSMPVDTRVSGFNSTSEKLMVEKSGRLNFYNISSQAGMPSPELTLINQTDSSAELTWTDASLEMGFAIQWRTLGQTEWTDAHTTEANETSWTANSLDAQTSYEFRVRAYTEEQSSTWSNSVYKQENDYLAALEFMLSPLDGSVVNSPETLLWTHIPWFEEYDVYLGVNEQEVTDADTSSDVYMGRVNSASYELLEALTNNTKYYWRVDPVGEDGPESGPVYSFTVSRIALDKSEINEQTVTGFADFKVSIELSAEENAVNWTALTEHSWVILSESNGTTLDSLNITLDASKLPVGENTSSITLTNDDGDLVIPITLKVEPLVFQHIRSDRDSSTVYAISENTGDSTSVAYLIELDSLTESIQRVKPVGSSVTDFAIHYADDLLYVTNWQDGNLLAIDRNSFEVTKIITFEPAGTTGYGGGDVYRVAAGVSQRIVVEEKDQWIDISLYNTNSETIVSRNNSREGGGAFSPDGRYYFHGDNNISNASIKKYDTSGDIFTQLTDIRPENMANYYGSRTIIVSEDGSRVFWSGVVFDNELESEWNMPAIIYSASEDGRYAFSDDEIYDVSLRLQVLSMPKNTTISGFNSTSQKLIVEVDGKVVFFEVSPQSTVPAPELSLVNVTDTFITLNWTDESLEMGFVIQRRIAGTDTWEDVYIAQANETQWTDNDIVVGTKYEYRIKASTGNDDSSWSNSVLNSEQPIAYGDLLYMTELKQYTLNVIANDIDPDGSIDADSVKIVTQPITGQVSILENGELAYTPSSDFELTDSFTYTVSDMNGHVTAPATVDIVYIPPPAISFFAQSRNSVILTWTHEAPTLWLDVFEVQKREQGTVTWESLPQVASDQNNLIVSELDYAKVYEFQMRGISQDMPTLWSNVLQSSLAPIATSDFVLMASIDKLTFNITDNDIDPEGQIDIDSIEIVEGAQLGEVIIESEGDVTYIPSSVFKTGDSFIYTVKDIDGVSSNEVSVEVRYITAPVIDTSNPTQNSLTVNWTHEAPNDLTFTFEIQQRITGGGEWQTVYNVTDSVTSWKSTGLQAETTYEFRVLAKNGDFKTVWSNTGAINTLSKPVVQPTKSESSGGSTGSYLLILMLFLLISRRVKLI